MVRLIIVIALLFSFSFADIYENNCIKCHKDLPVSIDKYFYRYLLKYSSEKSVKKAIKEYLKQPLETTTIMPKAFIKRFGIKDKTTLNDKELSKALDKYWEIYKVFGKLK